MKNKQDLVFLGGLFLFLLILFFMARPGSRVPERGFHGVALPSVSSGATTSLDACSTPKCLTVYVAPWCKICRNSTGVIAALSRYLKQHGVQTRIVVGNGSPDEVKDYAQQIGPDTLMDTGDKVPVSGGVPNFIVSDGKGQILESIPGVPGMYQPPYSEDVLKEFADYLHLP